VQQGASDKHSLLNTRVMDLQTHSNNDDDDDPRVGRLRSDRLPSPRARRRQSHTGHDDAHPCLLRAVFLHCHTQVANIVVPRTTCFVRPRLRPVAHSPVCFALRHQLDTCTSRRSNPLLSPWQTPQPRARDTHIPFDTTSLHASSPKGCLFKRDTKRKEKD